MDWNMKGGSWDLREIDERDIPNIETMSVDNYNNRSSRFGIVKGSSSSSSNGGEFCVDLKLGHVSNSVTVQTGTKLKTSDGGGSKTAGSTGKRGRGMSNGNQTASCLVDGCSSDMRNCREYHRRHKVCELHSKTPVVTIGGLNQRFCQQCSRFHSLEEFDEGKRSCRKRLDGHNRRRRKPQPVPLTRSSTLFSNYLQGRQLVPFSSSDSNMYTSNALVNPSCDWEWDGRTTVVYHNNNNNNSSTSSSYNKQQIFLGSSESSRIKQDMTMATLACSGSGSGSFSSPPPPCALSLLSSHSPPAPMYHLSQPLATAGTLSDHSLQEAVDTTLVVSNGTQPSMYNLFGSNSHSLPFHWG